MFLEAINHTFVPAGFGAKAGAALAKHPGVDKVDYGLLDKTCFNS